MKAYDFEAVIYGDDIYCVSCLPEDADEEEVHPIFASSEWDIMAVCCVCGEPHDYMNLIGGGDD